MSRPHGHSSRMSLLETICGSCSAFCALPLDAVINSHSMDCSTKTPQAMAAKMCTLPYYYQKGCAGSDTQAELPAACYTELPQGHAPHNAKKQYNRIYPKLTLPNACKDHLMLQQRNLLVSQLAAASRGESWRTVQSKTTCRTRLNPWHKTHICGQGYLS